MISNKWQENSWQEKFESIVARIGGAATSFLGGALLFAGCAATCDCGVGNTSDAASTKAIAEVGHESSDAVATHLETAEGKLNYAVGYHMGNSVADGEIPYREEAFNRGLEDGRKQRDKSEGALLDARERKKVLEAFWKQKQAEELDARAEVAKKNRRKADSFLATNGVRQNVVTTQSGLQYEVVVNGSGVSPKQTDTVEVHYRGYSIDGVEFDSSYERGQPVRLPVGGVIMGWTEALQLMKEGATWKLFIPAELSYGDTGAGPHIEPGQLLIFEVELVLVIAEADQGKMSDSEISTHYDDLPESFEGEVLGTTGQANIDTLDLDDNAVSSFIVDTLFANEPYPFDAGMMQSNIKSRYFYHIVLGQPDFVSEVERHTGYYAICHEELMDSFSMDQQLMAYAIYRIGRSSDNVRKIHAFLMKTLPTLVSIERYLELELDTFIRKLVDAHDYIVSLDDYQRRLDSLYDIVDSTYKERIPYDGAYGYGISDQYAYYEEFLNVSESSIDVYHLSFWVRRAHEGNAEAVLTLLKDIQKMYDQMLAY